MIVVADTSPISCLAELGLIDLLHRLYGAVLIPHEVHRELLSEEAPPSVRDLAAALPAWVEVRSSSENLLAQLKKLDDGERAAIQLALDVKAEIILVDEIAARRVAGQFGLKVAGTLAVLRDAHNAHWIDGRQAFKALCAVTTFYHSPDLDRLFRASLNH